MLLGRKVMTNLDSRLKSRDVTFSTKVRLVKAMVFPVVMYECESWTIKKAEHRRIDAFELWCLRRLLRVPWTARRSNQSILKEISPGCSLEILMQRLKLQYFGHLMRRADSFEKTLMLGRTVDEGTGDSRGWDCWMASLTQWTWVWVNSRSWWWTGRPGMLWFMGSQRVGHNWVIELNWQTRYCPWRQSDIHTMLEKTGMPVVSVEWYYACVTEIWTNSYTMDGVSDSGCSGEQWGERSCETGHVTSGDKQEFITDRVDSICKKSRKGEWCFWHSRTTENMEGIMNISVKW